MINIVEFLRNIVYEETKAVHPEDARGCRSATTYQFLESHSDLQRIEVGIEDEDKSYDFAMYDHLVITLSWEKIQTK